MMAKAPTKITRFPNTTVIASRREHVPELAGECNPEACLPFARKRANTSFSEKSSVPKVHA